MPYPNAHKTPAKSEYLKIHHLDIKYGRVHALSQLSLVISKGSLLAITGPNGSGKSTLLKAMMGLVSPTRGRIDLPSGATVAYLPQHTRLNQDVPLSVFDVVAMGLWSQTGPTLGAHHHHKIAVVEALEAMGLSDVMTSPFSDLSGGQMQRALFARVMVQDADIILLDEPFNNLDEPTVHDLAAWLVQWAAQGKTVVAVIHDLDIARTYFPQAALLARRLVAIGPTAEVLTVENLSAAYTLSRDNWIPASTFLSTSKEVL